MPAQKVSKKLPKRAASTVLKERRHGRWLKQQERKRQRQAENEARHRANVKRHERGELTPWELAKQKAKERKAGAAEKAA